MIPVQNIYYMLAYAFQVLNEAGYKQLATEQFRNVADLCAAILEKGTSVQIKRGLLREYQPKQEQLSALKGRIDMTESMKNRSMQCQKMICTYDEYTENAYLNRILKMTLLLLLKADIPLERKKRLRKVLVFFRNIDELDVHLIEWHQHYNRTNQTYQMLISICWLVVKGLLQSSSDGSTRLMDFLDEQRMCRLYEKFILEYYRKEHRELRANASQIPWVLDDDVSDMLPVMQSDITLKNGDAILIIDAKYYSRTTQAQYDVHTLNSGNLYQIFTYVKNTEARLHDQPHEVSGMLLYAKTDESVYPNHVYHMSGNRITVRTLDLNQSFGAIADSLDQIAADHFGAIDSIV